MNHSREIEFLSQLVMNKDNLLIIGPASSGKTSVLKALLNECPKNERLIILEDSKELDPPSEASTQLLTRFDARGVLPHLSLSELVRQSLRMRPDRLVVGEVRGNEAKELLLALATGHRGSFGTLHASDPWQALIRLEMLIQMGAPQWSLSAIRKLILLSLNYIIVCTRDREGQRKLSGIYKLISVEDSGVIIERVNF
jgi:pilus assembly protein CpaF